ncbi:GroES-like protein [Ascobolus immersus RN42]|uniref:GroES-like protein n=1 Tax=Ascobolus immersus RN42 TaxID=1160509 RepID=A0A3N4HYN2_ASCIM|nr:GroES-like protein [Ascobolus immersus RN42]
MAPQTQKEIHVKEDLSCELMDTPIPTPGPNQLLIKNSTFSINPKDWKLPLRFPAARLNTPTNPGDDVAGTIAAVGPGVLGFRVGDRVSGFHVMGDKNGAFAEYSIVPDWSAVHLPDEVDFDRGVTLTLAMYTAAVGLFGNLGYRAPWEPKVEKKDGRSGLVVIWGGSTTVGAYAIQLAKAAGLGPIITLAGNGAPFVRTLIDESAGDVIVDYRRSDAAEEVRRIAKEKGFERIDRVFDCVTDGGVAQRAGEIFKGQESGVLGIVNYLSDEEKAKIASNVTINQINVGSIHPGMGLAAAMGVPAEEWGRELGRVFSTWVAAAVRDGRFKTHPTQVVPGGLKPESVEKGLKMLMNGEVSAKKLVFRVEDTFKN